jgi:DNA-binding transcriptional regulator YhcF (GntR family)
MAGARDSSIATPTADAETPSPRLSYKYQRLRERIRQAIDSGELAGKLPGERALAKRFRVNAKTLSKALTDLAGEGLLERSIGLGTYVRGSVERPQEDRWLVLSRAEGDPMVDALRAANPQIQAVVPGAEPLRPSLLQQFKVVIDMSGESPDDRLRDLLVRGMHVVLVDREPGVFSTHAVLPDRAMAAANLARELMLQGHRRLMLIESPGKSTLSDVVRRVAASYGYNVAIDVGSPADAGEAVRQGVRAILCESEAAGSQVIASLSQAGLSAPRDAAVAAVGLTGDTPSVSGSYVTFAKLAETVVQLVRDPIATRPTTLWLSGTMMDRGTAGDAMSVTADAATTAQAIAGPLVG